MRESAFERYAVEKIKSSGARAFKWVCPGMTGAPDRIAVFPGGRIVFIEFKRPGRKEGMSERQKKVGKLLESLGCAVYRIGNKEKFKKMMEDYGYEV